MSREQPSEAALQLAREFWSWFRSSPTSETSDHQCDMRLAELLDGVRDGASESASEAFDQTEAYQAILDEIRNPCITPVGAPGSVMRQAWELGVELQRLRKQSTPRTSRYNRDLDEPK